jgi:phosphoserine aminotransferase
MLNILLTLVVAATALFAGANAQLVMNTPCVFSMQHADVVLMWMPALG